MKVVLKKMQAAMKELRSLRQEEQTMVALASRISDQLNRLKVEELALQNLIRQQNQEEDLEHERGPYVEMKMDPEDEEENMKPLDLEVNTTTQSQQEEEEEEEEEETHDDLAQYVESLTGNS